MTLAECQAGGGVSDHSVAGDIVVCQRLGKSVLSDLLLIVVQPLLLSICAARSGGYVGDFLNVLDFLIRIQNTTRSRCRCILQSGAVQRPTAYGLQGDALSEANRRSSKDPRACYCPQGKIR